MKIWIILSAVIAFMIAAINALAQPWRAVVVPQKKMQNQ